MAIRAAMAIRLMAAAVAVESVVKAVVGSYPGGGGGGSAESKATAQQGSYDTPAMAGQACLVAMAAPPVDMVLSLATEGGIPELAKAAQEAILEPNRIMFGGGGGAGGSAYAFIALVLRIVTAVMAAPAVAVAVLVTVNGQGDYGFRAGQRWPFGRRRRVLRQSACR